MSWLFPPLGINDSRTIANFEFMSSTIWYSYVQAHGVSNMRLKSDRWITEPHLIQILFVKPHNKSNSLLSYLVVVIFFCIWSHYTAMPPHTPPPRRILIIRQSPPITPRYNAQGLRSYRCCLLSQQRLLRHFIGVTFWCHLPSSIIQLEDRSDFWVNWLSSGLLSTAIYILLFLLDAITFM